MDKKKKQRYKLKNWSNYNQALINRGSLTLWFEESMIKQWHQPEKTGYRGSPMTYSDTAIQCALTLRELFKLPLRATQGCLLSLALNVNQPVAFFAIIYEMNFIKLLDILLC
ncbi:transposase [methane-oxidizing endosymbiont of Gigantopelta aegis]|uniref:transposase n=1 Tax=methane-oxidizing endosymbiont of Gigantopelta aegis TaxID=2794938 RepID=UPI0018DECC8A|nr:transposase [methane-oxidizing endosymbiont of Gigantopelta aegis]